MTDFYLFLDRVDEGIATLIPDGAEGELHLPLAYLPEDVREGDYLLVHFTIDAQKGVKEKEMIDDLFVDLGDNP